MSNDMQFHIFFPHNDKVFDVTSAVQEELDKTVRYIKNGSHWATHRCPDRIYYVHSEDFEQTAKLNKYGYTFNGFVWFRYRARIVQVINRNFYGMVKSSRTEYWFDGHPIPNKLPPPKAFEMFVKYNPGQVENFLLDSDPKARFLAERFLKSSMSAKKVSNITNKGR
jgi:hypothetical protein